MSISIPLEVYENGYADEYIENVRRSKSYENQIRNIAEKIELLRKKFDEHAVSYQLTTAGHIAKFEHIHETSGELLGLYREKQCLENQINELREKRKEMGA